MCRCSMFYVLLFAVSFAVSASDFEGVINMVRQSHYDTVYYQYYVKGNQVRIDEYGKDDAIRNVLLVHLEERKVYAINTEKKLFKELSANDEQIQSNFENYTIQKTQNKKVINGFACYQWRVRNEQRNSEIAYWVTKNGFDFYDRLLDVIRSFDNTSMFFRAIQDTNGFFPVLVVERTLVRYEKERLIVTAIEHKPVDIEVFVIPEDFRHFDY